MGSSTAEGHRLSYSSTKETCHIKFDNCRYCRGLGGLQLWLFMFVRRLVGREQHWGEWWILEITGIGILVLTVW